VEPQLQQPTPPGGRPDGNGQTARSRARLTSSIPVRFPEEMLEHMRQRAEEDHRTISSWIRHIVQQELEAPAAPDAVRPGRG
jgi:hypothetical protein